MTNQYRYFIIAAEEQNLKRAADRAFISPQGMSNAIKQLESELGVVLFNRIPKLTLTPEGEILLRAAKEILTVEENMIRQFADSQQSYPLQINMGIQSCCQSYLVSLIVPKFLKKYPLAKLNVVCDFSDKLEKAVADGSLDFFVGDGEAAHENLCSTPLIEEKLYLIVSQNLLKNHFGDQWQEKLHPETGRYNYLDFIYLPLIQYPAPSRLGDRITKYAENHGCLLNTVFESNDASIFPMLCHNDLGAAIISEYHIKTLKALNQTVFADNPVEIFLLNQLESQPNVIYLAYHRKKYMTQCHRDLITMIVQAMRSEDSNENKPTGLV